jgi:uncharacterized damage-inducible protein DinB
VEQHHRSDRSAALAERLRQAAERLVAVIEPIDDARWRVVPEPGVWSIGKDAEHVAEAAGYHLWIVRLTIGEKVSSRRPAPERKQMTSGVARREAVQRIRQRAEDGAQLILGLSEEQLDLPTKPPRANGPVLAETIERVLVGHFDTHRAAIEAKLES